MKSKLLLGDNLPKPTASRPLHSAGAPDPCKPGRRGGWPPPCARARRLPGGWSSGSGSRPPRCCSSGAYGPCRWSPRGLQSPRSCCCCPARREPCGRGRRWEAWPRGSGGWRRRRRSAPRGRAGAVRGPATGWCCGGASWTRLSPDSRSRRSAKRGCWGRSPSLGRAPPRARPRPRRPDPAPPPPPAVRGRAPRRRRQRPDCAPPGLSGRRSVGLTAASPAKPPGAARVTPTFPSGPSSSLSGGARTHSAQRAPAAATLPAAAPQTRSPRLRLPLLPPRAAAQLHLAGRPRP